MTEKKAPRRRKLSHEILGLLAICLVIALFLFYILSLCAVAIADWYLFDRDIVLTDTQQFRLDNWIINLSLLVSVGFFVVLFLFLLGERLSYIREIVKGIDALQAGKTDVSVPLEGNNELTRLAESVNYLSVTRQKVMERERALNEEKEQLIRTLSHDIRTPLTSILSYSEYLLSQKCEQGEYLELMQKKALQIKKLTDILLDGGKRNPEYFENARLLMEQLAEEFAESLEEDFPLKTDLSGCPAFPGTFDVEELRRVFDNLSSNVRKYADPGCPVTLSISVEEGSLVIRQENRVKEDDAPAESHRMGLNSIRRIAHSYGGRVDIRQESGMFAVAVTLSDI